MEYCSNCRVDVILKFDVQDQEWKCLQCGKSFGPPVYFVPLAKDIVADDDNDIWD